MREDLRTLSDERKDMTSENKERMSHLQVVYGERMQPNTKKRAVILARPAALEKEKTGARRDRSSLRSDTRQKKGVSKPTPLESRTTFMDCTILVCARIVHIT